MVVVVAVELGASNANAAHVHVSRVFPCSLNHLYDAQFVRSASIASTCSKCIPCVCVAVCRVVCVRV